MAKNKDQDDLQAQAEAESKADLEKDQSRSELKSINIIGKIIGALVLLWLISISYYAFAFFVLGMLPALTAMVIDRGSGRFASKTVTASNFVGIMGFLFEIAWSYEPDIASKELMRNTMTWLFIYGYAAVGWLLIWILPQLTVVFFTVRADIKTERLKLDQQELIAKWGEEVKSGKRKKIE